MPCPSMWPKQFWSIQNGFGLTKFIWTWPKWNGHDQNKLVRYKLWFILVENHNLDHHFGRDHFIFGREQIITVKSKSIWLDQNCFGHIEGQGISEKFCILNCLTFDWCKSLLLTVDNHFFRFKTLFAVLALYFQIYYQITVNTRNQLNRSSSFIKKHWMPMAMPYFNFCFSRSF